MGRSFVSKWGKFFPREKYNLREDVEGGGKEQKQEGHISHIFWSEEEGIMDMSKISEGVLSRGV